MKDFNVGRVDCAKLSDPNQCFTQFQIHKYPTYVLFKSASYLNGLLTDQMNENWYEINYNSRQTPQDLSAFVKENAYTSVRTLTQFDPNIIASEFGNKFGYFVDFFAPVITDFFQLFVYNYILRK